MYENDLPLYFHNGKEASEYFGVTNARINRATKSGSDYELGKVRAITKKEYLEKTNKIYK